MTSSIVSQTFRRITSRPINFTARPSLPQSRLKQFNKGSLRSRPTHQHQYRSYASGPKGSPNKSRLPVVPIILITLTGSLSYAYLVKSRAEPMPSLPSPPPQSSDTTSTFSPAAVTVIFVLGGPGAGKGTQCANLVRDFGFTHLSAGDLLREEQDRKGSEFGELIKGYIREGKIVPMEVTVALLEGKMREVLKQNEKDGKGDTGRFLIDGFPRKMDQALRFESHVCPSKFTLFFDCPFETLQKRLLERGKTSGRSDDNIESIKKRFKTFEDTSMPVVDYFQKEGKVVRIDSTKSKEAVYAETKDAMVKRLKDTEGKE